MKSSYAQPQLRSGRHASSPDGKLYVYYEAPTFEIRDSKTSAVLGSKEQEQPVLAVRWTGDSKTLVIVEHIAHGSYASFLHWDGTAWRPRSVETPFERLIYRGLAVVDVKPDRETVDIKYKTYIPTRLISFTYIPVTGNATNIRRHDITFERWQHLGMFPSE